MDRLNAMSIFVAVAEAGSLAKVARERRISRPAVTRAIKALEDHVGVQLLNRTTHNLSLTEAGERYLASTRRILADIADGERAAAGDHGRPTGHLRLTVSVMFSTLHVVPILSEFLAKYTEVSTTLICADRVVDFVEDGIDVAVRISDWADPSLGSLQCGTVQRVLVASPDYLARNPPLRQPSDLHSHRLLAFTGLMPNRRLQVAHKGKLSTIELTPSLEINDAPAAITAAEAGLGYVQLLDYKVAHQLKDGSLVRILAEFSPPPVPVRLIHASGRVLPAKTRAFLDFVGPRLRDRLRQLADEQSAR